MFWILKRLTLRHGDKPLKPDTTRATRRGYHKLSENAEENGSDGETEGNSSYSGSDFSEYDEDTDSEYDEALTCNVCDRSFSSTRVLAQHQQKKRHFGCSICDEIFPSLMSLEQHKEGLDHWSEDEGNTHDSESDVDSDAEKSEPEELECLL